MVEAVLLWTSVPSDLLPCSVIQPTAVQPVTSQDFTETHTEISDGRVWMSSSSYLHAYTLFFPAHAFIALDSVSNLVVFWGSMDKSYSWMG